MTLSVNTLRRINMVMFNGLWYMLLLVAGGLLPLWLVWLVPLYGVVHLIGTPYGWSERVLIGVALAIGLLAELASQHFHCISYSDSGVIAGIPLWILMMWLNFALSLAHSWWPWMKHWWVGLIVGAMAAFFPYFGAQKAGILQVQQPIILVLFWLSYGVLASYGLNRMYASYQPRQD